MRPVRKRYANALFEISSTGPPPLGGRRQPRMWMAGRVFFSFSGSPRLGVGWLADSGRPASDRLHCGPTRSSIE